VCLGGASQVAANVFNPNPDPRLRAMVVWVGGAWITDRDIRYASTRFLDPRAAHLWDSRGALTKAYRRTLKVPDDPWDVYLVYGPQARWTGADPPVPDYWMQMLGFPQAPLFDPAEFGNRVRGMLVDGNS
jgi:hypothetical protein